jgi:Ca2+/Na+ antiporter
LAYVKKKSVAPIYLVGVTWLLWAVFGQLYRPVHYIMAALVSAIVYYVGKMIWPDRGYQTQDEPQKAQPTKTQAPQKEEKKPQSTGNPEIDALITERDRAVSEMQRLNASIQDPTISKQISHLEATTGKIIGAVVEKPAKLPQIRKFMNYYLPTTLKLLNAYDRMDSTGVSGANIDGTKGKIEDMMSTICTAFDKQLDALYGEEALDISTDIKVLENMLAQEGLGGMTLGGQ